MQIALVVVVALIACALVCGCAYALVHDGTTPAPPTPATTRR
jgi:hypothetical protein